MHAKFFWNSYKKKATKQTIRIKIRTTLSFYMGKLLLNQIVNTTSTKQNNGKYHFLLSLSLWLYSCAHPLFYFRFKFLFFFYICLRCNSSNSHVVWYIAMYYALSMSVYILYMCTFLRLHFEKIYSKMVNCMDREKF